MNVADMVEGIGRKAALGEIVVAVGKHLFRSEGLPFTMGRAPPAWQRKLLLHLALIPHPVFRRCIAV